MSNTRCYRCTLHGDRDGIGSGVGRTLHHRRRSRLDQRSCRGDCSVLVVEDCSGSRYVGSLKGDESRRDEDGRKLRSGEGREEDAFGEDGGEGSGDLSRSWQGDGLEEGSIDAGNEESRDGCQVNSVSSYPRD